MRSSSETKLMDAFLQIHEGTIIRVVIGVLVMLAIALVLYGFGRCWCARLHKLCGETDENADNEINRMELGKGETRGVMIK